MSNRLSLLVTGAIFFILAACDAVGDCLDDGGYWNYSLEKCECTYTARGHYEENPTPEQFVEADRCDALAEHWISEMKKCESANGEWDSKYKKCESNEVESSAG